MATEHQSPSLSPAEDDSLHGVLRSALFKHMQRVDDMMPVRVIAYDRKTNRATVQPVIKMVGTDGAEVPRAQLISIPVYQPAGGGFKMSFPIKEGDFGYVKALDRDVSLFRQGLQDAKPNSLRMKSFEDGFFMPDLMRDFNHADDDENGFILSSDDGSIRLVMDGGQLRITAPKAIFDVADVHLTGNLKVDGSVEGQNGVKLETHTHGGVETGGGNTGEPNGE